MDTYIALIRGINVGGRGRLLMKDLRSVLEGLGLVNVKTYLQSGNAVFQSRSHDGQKLSHDIGEAIREISQVTPEVVVLTVEELQSSMASNPFPEGESDPTSLHVFFLKSRPENPDLAKLESLRTNTEKFELLGTCFYLHAPDGIGRSKLAANVEKVLDIGLTARNWRSVKAVMSLALEVG